MESLFIVFAVTGAVELLRRLQVRDYFAALTILAAGAIGALSGVFGVDGLTVTQGIIAGLAASGLVTTAKKVG